MKTISKQLLVILCFCSLWACDQKSTSQSPIQSARQYRNGYPQNIGYNTVSNNYLTGTAGGVNSYGNNSGWGRIYSTYNNEFNQALGAFVSSFMDPRSMGSVDPQNGVFIQGHIDINQSSINLNNSNLRIAIWDTYAVSHQSNEIRVSFARAVSGQMLSPTSFVVEFADQYGSVVLQGQIGQGTIRGKVSYVNLVSAVDQGSRPPQGDLGDFEVATTAFINTY